MKPIRHVRPRAVVLAENKAAAEKLRNEGYNYAEIAMLIDVPKSTVHSWFKVAAKRITPPESTKFKEQRDLLKELQAAKREIAALKRRRA